MSLTAVGARVVGHARRVLEEVAAIERAAEQTRGDARIGYTCAALGQHTTAVQRRRTPTHRPAEAPARIRNRRVSGARAWAPGGTAGRLAA
ncbi:hypothetical protein [Geodermatophilus obscurus]|uniref:hypothetical protein n=1 Tax=Geodermatophilus obscurus TaxID=1861 RepID=UPI0015880C49|nr:hypothetical protein [Geodermatophilus obscurus]